MTTGYSNQTKLFVPRIRALGHDIAITAFWGLKAGVVDWNGIPVYPGVFQEFGNDVAASHARHFRADVLISLVDALALDPNQFGSVPWVPWFPVDTEPMRPGDLRVLRKAYQPVVYSRFGERVAQEAGLEVRYVPHGVDARMFRPTDRQRAREQMRLPTDRWIVGMVAANKGRPSRKAFVPSIQAFAAFKRRHQDALLYLHSYRGRAMNGEDLQAICAASGLSSEDVKFASQYSLMSGMYDDKAMAALYNAMDVLLAASCGEGFGIPILEAQACGCPVIVGDWTAMPEICFAGWKIDRSTGAEKFWTNFESWQWMPRAGAIEGALDAAYAVGADEQLGRAAREGAMAYDADRVVREHWRPVLEELERGLCSGKGKLQLVQF